MAKFIHVFLLACSVVMSTQMPAETDTATTYKSASSNASVTDPKHRAVHQYRSVCHEDGTCSYIFTLTVPSRLGAKLNLPNMEALTGTTSVRSDKEIEAFKQQLFHLHSQLLNLTRNTEKEKQMVHTDVEDLRLTVTNIDGKLSKMDRESKMLNDGVAHLTENVTSMARRLEEENMKAEEELNETMEKIDLAKLRIKRIEKLIKGEIDDDELILTIDSDSRHTPIQNVIGEPSTFTEGVNRRAIFKETNNATVDATIQETKPSHKQSLKEKLTSARGDLAEVEEELKRLETHFDLYKTGVNEDELDQFQYVIKMQEPKLPQPIAIGTDCATLYENDMTKNGIYRIQPDPTNDTQRFEVYCDMETDGGGWTLIQRREDGSEDFYKGWQSYKDGFGDLNGEHWLGLDNIYFLNQMGNKVIRFDMWDFEGNYAYAEYKKFRLMDESHGYRIQVGRYNGTAGNAFHYSNYHLRHNNMKFSTFDHNDNPYGRNCPRLYQSGWWFHNCMIANLNGLYYHGHNGYYESHFKDGIMWQPWKTSLSLKKTEIKIRPTNFGEGSTKIRMSG